MIKLKEYSEIEDKTALDFGEDVRKMHQSEDYKDYVGFNFDELVWDPDLTWEWVPNNPEQEAIWTRDAFGLDKLADYSMNIINELCHTDPQLVINKIKENKAVIGKYDDNWYGVVYDLVGHGIGTHMHEEPEIPNFRKLRRGLKLRSGMTFAVEPMINEGKPEVEWLDDEWTVVTEDGSLSAHYENTIVITKGRPEILTLTEEEIQEGIWENP